jgi:predicted ATPase/DNA-binding winged helix-turn-helix (wHTH) protein
MPAEGARPIYASGECEVDLARRELRILGSPVPLGGRAFEIIEVLAQSPGQLVTKSELMHRIWPGAIVMDGTLHVHAAAVRKALGPYRGLLKTESRRGYRLLGDWSVRRHDATLTTAGPRRLRVADDLPATNLPAVVTRLIGRSTAVQRLHDIISAYRVVTLTGPGGIGKTALTLTVAHRAVDGFADGAWLVELAPLSDPHLVPQAVASALGLRLGSDVDPTEAVARAIGTKQLLLVLDNCEHLIDAAAALAAMIVCLCPRATILATSRELLRIEGEYAYGVAALDVPTNEHTAVDQILGHSAPELFITRANELGVDFSSQPECLPTIATICRHLDGIPLAIEMAAARAATLGLTQVAAALRDRLTLMKSTRRAPLPRHHTLRATLDWSYELLPEFERRLLRHLAVFSGGFSLAAVNAVANQRDASEADIADGVENLVAKSLVVPDITAGDGFFRLLETTRAYALAKLTESGELLDVARRHAEYFKVLLENIENEWEKRSTPLAHLDNARAALEWCFGATGNAAIGVGLAATVVPIFLAVSLLPECHRWSNRALCALDDDARGGSEEMHLQASLGVSSMQIYGQSNAARDALRRSLAIAQARGDVLNQVGLLGMLSMFEVRDGDFRTSLRDAQLSRAAAGSLEDSAPMALANSNLGRALQFVGEHRASRQELEASFHYWSHSPRTSEVYLGLDHHILVGIGLARNLWLQGHPVQATERLRQTIRDAERKHHPASLGLALSWTPGLFLWVGDHESAEEHANRLLAHAEMHDLRPYRAVARGYQGALAINRGDPRAGVEDLRCCLEQLDTMRYRMLNTGFKLSLVHGLVAVGLFADALTLADDTISLIEANGDLVHMPEALRVRGRVLLSIPRSLEQDAETCFVRSIECSRRQGARSWELRTAIDLAALWASRGQHERAYALLEPIFATFGEGLETADLRAARHLLATLRDRSATLPVVPHPSSASGA